MRNLLLRAMVIAVAGVLCSSAAANAEPVQEPTIELGPVQYESEEDLVAARDAAIAAVAFDPTVVTDFDLLGRRGAIVRLLRLRQLALDEAAESLNTATATHLAAKAERRGAATNLEGLQENLLVFAVDSYVLGDQASTNPLDGSQDAIRRGFTIEKVTNDLMGEVTIAYNRLLELIDEEADAEAAREYYRDVLVKRQDEQTEAIHFLHEFEAKVKAREDAIKLRIEVTLAESYDGIQMVEVGGIRVNEEIGEQLELLLEAALNDGIELGGGGYRSRASQIDLRRAHCGSSEYAIFDMPSSSCSPPTARPGASQHELGLAIDFTENGSILTRSSPGFLWLQEHAAEFGLINLPSEAWHWSTTGR